MALPEEVETWIKEAEEKFQIEVVPWPENERTIINPSRELAKFLTQKIEERDEKKKQNRLIAETSWMREPDI
jgi:hypothetical protein